MVKVEHEPTMAVCPAIVVPTKIKINDLLLCHTSLDASQGVQKQLLWIDEITVLTPVMKGVGANSKLIRILCNEILSKAELSKQLM